MLTAYLIVSALIIFCLTVAAFESNDSGSALFLLATVLVGLFNLARLYPL